MPAERPNSSSKSKTASSGSATKVTGSAPSTGPSALQSQLAPVNRLAYLFAAAVCFIFFTVLAMVQPPRGTPHPIATPADFAFWAYPLVVNDIKRLPLVTVSGASANPTLNAVWVSGQHVWIAGDNGILLHSTDAGVTWEKLPKPPSQNVQTSQSRAWFGVMAVHAAEQSTSGPAQSAQIPNGNSKTGSTGSPSSAVSPSDNNRDNANPPAANAGPNQGAQTTPTGQNVTPPPQRADQSAAKPTGNSQTGSPSGTSPVVSPYDSKSDNAKQPPANAPYQPKQTTPPATRTFSIPPPSTRVPSTRPLAPKPARVANGTPEVDSAARSRALGCFVNGANLTAVYFSNKETLYVQRGESSASDLCNTTDMAQTWFAVSRSSADTDLLDALRASASASASLRNGNEVRVDTKEGIAIGKGGQWTTRPSHTGATLKAVHFGDDRLGFAVGSAGTAVKTIDGGANWFPVLQGLDGERLGNRQPHKLPAPWYYLSWIAVAVIARPSWKRPAESDLRSEETIADIGISDRPLEPGDPDPLGYRDLALSISKFLRNENTIAPITIAITGEWGTGKSSIMNLLRRDLASRGLQSVWFNAWHNQTEDDLFATILQAIRKEGVPQWWEMDYPPFALRLLWIRWKSRWQSITPLLMATALLAGIEWQHRNNHTVPGFFDSFRNWQTFINSLQNLSQDALWAFVICVLYALKQLRDGLKAFGVDPASLLASRSGTTSLPDLEKQTALRQSFAAELRDVTQALGKRRRLVMFVDDLDRCMPENIRVVLEAVNFIVTSGECFIIMGLSRRPVEAGIGLSFERIAGEMTWSMVAAGGDADELAKSKRWEFSRQYLDKLINIEIPARPVSTARYEDLVLQNARAASPAELLSRITSRGLKIALPVIVSVLLIVSMALLGMWIGGRKEEPINTPNPQSVGSATAAQKAPPQGGTSTAPPPALPAVATFSLDLPDKTRNSRLTYIWPFLGTGLLLYACWRVLIRKEGVIVKDSPRFRKALGVWDTVIVGTHLTPRSTKRFMNRLRCLAMRLRPGVEEETRWSILWRRGAKPPTTTTDATKNSLPETMLVALSAIYDIAPELIRNDELFSNVLAGKFELVSSSQGEPLVAKPMQKSLRSAIEKHELEFAAEWPPTADQRLAFLNLCADVTVRG